MSYLSELAALTDELIDAVAAVPKTQKRKLQSLRESTVQSLLNQNFLRTNQFEVQNRLAGLVERFRIINREPLGDALEQRLDALKPHVNDFTPEVLHFLLELSDKPAQKSRLSDLERLKEPEKDVVPKLTWRQIAKEDGWHQERALWKILDHAPSSDEEDYYEREHVASDVSIASPSTASSVPDDAPRTAQDLAIKLSGGEELLRRILDSQDWRNATHDVDPDGRQKKTPITSLQLLREVVFMLRGLPTSLFDLACKPVPDYVLEGVSWQTYDALVNTFSECGRKLAPLRIYASKKEKEEPLLQVFQDSLQRALQAFDQELTAIQGRFVAIHKDVIVSLVAMLAELGPSLAPLYVLSGIVQQVHRERNTKAFRYLELLYDAVGMAQMEGSLDTYKLLGTIFLDCFQVYLKPIRFWMEEGELLAGDRIFFIGKSSARPQLHQIWEQQFHQLVSSEGVLNAPRFLSPAVDRIVRAGKSIVVLKHLKRYSPVADRMKAEEPPMDFAAVCSDGTSFAPFSELFGNAFNKWIQSKYHSASITLLDILFDSYGLSRAFDALRCLYLMSDGATSDAFASTIFRQLDNFSTSWNDKFTLTEIAQEAFSQCVAGHRLSADIEQRYIADSPAASRASVRNTLPAIRLIYHLPWPIQMIISPAEVKGYQTMFVFLLQTCRAIYLLKHPLLGTTMTPARHQSTYYLLRTKLLWFCNTMMSYLTTLVFAPNINRMDKALQHALDVDDVGEVHSKFLDRILSESCQGKRLRPIRDCILDIYDLAIKLEDSHQAEMARLEEEQQEISRLSTFSASQQQQQRKRKTRAGRTASLYSKTGLGVGNDGEDDGDDDDEGKNAARVIREEKWKRSIMEDARARGNNKSTAAVMKEMHSDFERHLRFVASGLRGVARGSREDAAAKWDLLAEMLEGGIKEARHVF
ncbi:Spc98 family domain-containing protein [Neurospora intermedia]|uniref:Spindle pole body component n=1 Tax=Neurospora intermedia TaxID=5142 RepID=A0ABR3D477_NEUIN